MIRVLVSVFGGLLGLAFGSFLNVCVTRWPEGESVIHPHSHCRTCGRTLAWWENVPVVSWLLLRGRCRTCGVQIGWRHTLVEAALGLAWALIWWRALSDMPDGTISFSPLFALQQLEAMFLSLVLVGLAALDAEHFWLPDMVTLPTIALGLLARGANEALSSNGDNAAQAARALGHGILAAAAGAAVVGGIRLVYWLVRHKEGIGWGDAKLMALLGAWMGFAGAILAFVLAVVMGASIAVAMYQRRSRRGGVEIWASSRLPLGTFLCAGGIVACLWGPELTAAYLRWAGF